MSPKRLWCEIRDEVWADFERAARIDELKWEMDRQVAASDEFEDSPGNASGSQTGSETAAAPPRRVVQQAAG